MNHQDEQMKNTFIRSSIRMRIPLNKQSEVLEILKSVCEEIRFDPNCAYTRLYRDANEVEIVMLEELWADDQELNRHLQSNSYRRILLAIEMADTPPEIRFDRISGSSGFETIKTARTNC